MRPKAALFSMPFVLAVIGACGADSSRPTPGPIGPPTVAESPAPAAPKPSSNPLIGTYRLALSIGPECAAVPESARNHAYTATIEERTPSTYTVTLGDGRFLDGLICDLRSGPAAGLGCNQFVASQAGSDLTIQMINSNDEKHGGHIVTQTAHGQWLEIIGEASARAEGDVIGAVGTTSVWFCPTPSAGPFPCRAAPVGCEDASLKMEFTRQP